jgi:hypothetical protein
MAKEKPLHVTDSQEKRLNSWTLKFSQIFGRVLKWSLFAFGIKKGGSRGRVVAQCRTGTIL